MSSPRHRTRESGPVTGISQRIVKNSSGSVVQSDDYQVTLHHTVETMDDVVTQDFAERSGSGEVIINPMTYVKDSTETIGSGYHEWVSNTNQTYIKTGPGMTEAVILRNASGVVPAPNAPEPSYDMSSAAKHQALGNIDRSPYAFMEDVFEFRETLRFLRNPLGSIRKLSKEFNRDVRVLKKRYRQKSLADAIADVWLQYQFAFSPLLRSSLDLIEAQQDKTHRPERRTARGSSKFEDMASAHEEVNGRLSTSSVQVMLVERAGVLYEVANPLNDWRYKYGLRFKNIPETLWAVLPYSFMVDRVWDISESIRGITAFLDPNVKILGAWTTTRSETITARTYLGYEGPNVQSVVSMVPDTYQTKRFVYSRASWNIEVGDFVPGTELEGLINSSTKIADLAALIYRNIT